jgi:hypothetical protein
MNVVPAHDKGGNKNETGCVAGKNNDFVVRGLSVLGECEPTYFDEEITNTEDSVNRKTRRGKPKK